MTVDDNIWEIQIVNLREKRIFSQMCLINVPDFSVKFNREFYCTPDDYKDAYVSIVASNCNRILNFNAENQIVEMPFYNGFIEIIIPKIHLTLNDKIWEYGQTVWSKDIEQNDILYLQLPTNCQAALLFNESPIRKSFADDGKILFELGNSVWAYDEKDDDFPKLQLQVTGSSLQETYEIGRVSFRERFREQVIFSYCDNSLYWNSGGGFIGEKKCRTDFENNR